MKIGLIIYGDLAQVTGGYGYDRMLVEHCRRHGDTVEVISIPYRNYSRHLMDNFSRSLKVRLLRGRWDVLLQDAWNHPSLFLMNNFIRGRVSYPIVSVVHCLRCDEDAPAWKQTIYRQLEKRYFASVDGCVFNSHTLCRGVSELAGSLLESIVVYPGKDRFNPFVSHETIKRRVESMTDLRILFLGNVIPRKGLHVLIDALTRIKRMPWRLDIAGNRDLDRKYVRSIDMLVSRNGVRDRVSFHGIVHDEKASQLLANSHLLAVPSLYEAFGIAYLEGLRHGIPAIASSRGGAGEMIRDLREGFLVDPGDAETIFRRIERLGQDRELLFTMSVQAWERSKAFPDWNESAAAVRGFLARRLIGA